MLIPTVATLATVARQKLIGVQFIKMTPTFIHNDLQQQPSPRPAACWQQTVFHLSLRIIRMIIVPYFIQQMSRCAQSVVSLCCAAPESLFFITRCHQICSAIKIFTLIRSENAAAVISWSWPPLPR